MEIKDFKKGQEVYIVSLNKGYMYKGKPLGPSMNKTAVKTVGRKYVTTVNGRQYQPCVDEYSLEENNTCGERTRLCPTMEYALLYIEREGLIRWLYKAVDRGHKYTLGQLRKVKEILTEAGRDKWIV